MNTRSKCMLEEEKEKTLNYNNYKDKEKEIREKEGHKDKDKDKETKDKDKDGKDKDKDVHFAVIKRERERDEEIDDNNNTNGNVRRSERLKSINHKKTRPEISFPFTFSVPSASKSSGTSSMVISGGSDINANRMRNLNLNDNNQSGIKTSSNHIRPHQRSNNNNNARGLRKEGFTPLGTPGLGNASFEKFLLFGPTPLSSNSTSNINSKNSFVTFRSVANANPNSTPAVSEGKSGDKTDIIDDKTILPFDLDLPFTCEKVERQHFFFDENVKLLELVTKEDKEVSNILPQGLTQSHLRVLFEDVKLSCRKQFDMTKLHKSLVAEYFWDIYEALREKEKTMYKSESLILSPKSTNMRALLLDWIFDVREHSNYSRATLHLAADYVDRALVAAAHTFAAKASNSNPGRSSLSFDFDYVSPPQLRPRNQLLNSSTISNTSTNSNTTTNINLTAPISDNSFIVDKPHFQLLGATAIFIASKVDEDTVIRTSELVDFCGGVYSSKEIIEMEQKLLPALQYRLCPPTAYTFVRRILGSLWSSSSSLVQSMANFLCDLSLFYFPMRAFPPSIIGAACVCLSRYFLLEFEPIWTPLLESITKYSIEDIASCVICLTKAWQYIKKKRKTPWKHN